MQNFPLLLVNKSAFVTFFFVFCCNSYMKTIPLTTQKIWKNLEMKNWTKLMKTGMKNFRNTKISKIRMKPELKLTKRMMRLRDFSDRNRLSPNSLIEFNPSSKFLNRVRALKFLKKKSWWEFLKKEVEIILTLAQVSLHPKSKNILELGLCKDVWPYNPSLICIYNCTEKIFKQEMLL